MSKNGGLPAASLLLVEDNPDEVQLIERMLAQEPSEPQFGVDVSDTLKGALGKLGTSEYDAILLDLGLPDSEGLNTFAEVSAAAPKTPIIVLTGLHDEEVALRAVRDGAQDYLLKSELAGRTLTRSIKYAVERKRYEERLRARAEEIESARLRAETYFDFMAHDVANILSPIMTYAELIRDSRDVPPAVVDRANKILTQVRRATSLMLNLRRLEEVERKTVRELGLLDVREALSVISHRLSFDCPDRSVTVNLTLPPDISIRAFGGEHLESILYGIAQNAVIHSHSETVSIDVCVAKVEEVGGHPTWRIEIADHGPGIQEWLKGALSVPQVVSKDIRRAVASSLSMYSAMLKHMGGSLSVEDRVPGDPSSGTKVVVVIGGA